MDTDRRIWTGLHNKCLSIDGGTIGDKDEKSRGIRKKQQIVQNTFLLIRSAYTEMNELWTRLSLFFCLPLEWRENRFDARGPNPRRKDKNQLSKKRFYAQQKSEKKNVSRLGFLILFFCVRSITESTAIISTCFWSMNLSDGVDIFFFSAIKRCAEALRIY